MIRNNINGFGNDSHSVILLNGEENLAAIIDTPIPQLPTGSTYFNEVSNGGTTHICTTYSVLGIDNPYPMQDAAIKRFDTSSWLFPSTANSLGILVGSGIHSDWQIGDDDFTLDYWEYNSNNFISIGTQTIFIAGCYIDDDNLWGIQYTIVGGAPGVLTFHFICIALGVTLVDITFLPGINANIFTHYAVVKKDSTINLYMDGVFQQTGVLATIPDIQTNFIVGTFDGTGGAYDRSVHVDEFRLSKGIARWLNNFIVPNRAY